MPEKRAINVIKSDRLSKDPWEPRFIIVDAETGEVLDDAQGYGYKSAQKAHAAWGWKNRDPKLAAKEKAINKWFNKQKKLENLLGDYAFYRLKDHEKLTDGDIEQALEELDLKLPDCTIKEFRRAVKI